MCDALIVLQMAWINKGFEGGVSLEAEALLLQADKSFVAADDYVVQHFYFQDLACFHQSAGNDYVVGAGGGITGGVVVDNDNGGAVLPDGGSEDFRRTGHGGIHVAHVDLPNAHDFVLGVEQDRLQVFLVQEAHLAEEETCDVSGRVDGESFGGLQVGESTAQGHGCKELAGFGFADAVLRTEFDKVGPCQARQSAEVLEKALGHDDDAFSLDAGSEQYGDKLGVADVVWAEVLKFFSRALRGGSVPNHSAVGDSWRLLHGLTFSRPLRSLPPILPGR